MMQLLLYQLFLRIYKLAITVASIWNTKAKQMLVGRKNFWNTISIHSSENKKIIWMHCASVGEYQQGLPLLQAIKQKFPQSRIVVTFFSSSGYLQFVKNDTVDNMYYLPFDSKKNAEKWMKIVKPTMAIFVKYELWYYYLKTLSDNKIPTYIISMYLPNNHIFGKWYGSFQKRMLGFFTSIFVQNKNSKAALQKLGFGNVIVAGDTRYDRMLQVVETKFTDEKIASFCENKNIFIAGSTWPEDEKLLANWWQDFNEKENWKIIIAPHEVSEKAIKMIQNLFENSSITYQNFSTNSINQILILDTVGMLSKIYRYANIVYIGGGFGSGIHNILEPISYGKSVVHGPNCKRFLEADIFGKLGVAIVVENAPEMKKAFDNFKNNINQKLVIQKQFTENMGAVKVIMETIFEN
jgi:3-deoxy-D-manno-octulosonic-acid transferase